MSKYVYNAWNASFVKSIIGKKGYVTDLEPAQAGELAPGVYEQKRTQDWLKAGRLKEISSPADAPSAKPKDIPEEELAMPTFDPHAGVVEPRTEGDAVVLEQKAVPEKPQKASAPPSAKRAGDSVVTVAPAPEPDKAADKGSPIQTQAVKAGDSVVVVDAAKCDCEGPCEKPVARATVAKKEETTDYSQETYGVYKEMMEMKSWKTKVKFVETLDDKKALQCIIDNTRPGVVNEAAKSRLEKL